MNESNFWVQTRYLLNHEVWATIWGSSRAKFDDVMMDQARITQLGRARLPASRHFVNYSYLDHRSFNLTVQPVQHSKSGVSSVFRELQLPFWLVCGVSISIFWDLLIDFKPPPRSSIAWPEIWRDLHKIPTLRWPVTYLPHHLPAAASRGLPNHYSGKWRY